MMPGIDRPMINIGGGSTLSADELGQLIIGLRKIVFDYNESTGLYNKNKLQIKFCFRKLVYLLKEKKEDGLSYEEFKDKVKRIVDNKEWESKIFKNSGEKSFWLESSEEIEAKEQLVGDVSMEEYRSVIVSSRKYQKVNCINFYETDEINLSLIIDSKTAYLCGFNIYNKQNNARQFIIYGKNDKDENKTLLDGIIKSLETCNDDAKIVRIPISIDYGIQSCDFVIDEKNLFFIANMHLADCYSNSNYFYGFVGLVFECARNPALQNVVIRQLKIGGNIQLSDLVYFGKNLTSSDYNGLLEHLSACGSIAAYQYFNDGKIIKPKDFYTILCKLYAFKEQDRISVDQQNFCIEMFSIIKSTKLQSDKNICNIFHNFYGEENFSFNSIGNYLVELFRKEWFDESLSGFRGNVKIERYNLIKVLGDLGSKACKEYLGREYKFIEEFIMKKLEKLQNRELAKQLSDVMVQYFLLTEDKEEFIEILKQKLFWKILPGERVSLRKIINEDNDLLKLEYYKDDQIFCEMLLNKREKFCEIFPDLRDCPFIDEFSDAFINYCVSKYPWLDNRIEINPMELKSFMLSEIGPVEVESVINIILERPNMSKLREYSLTNGTITLKTDTVKTEDNDEQLSFHLK